MSFAAQTTAEAVPKTEVFLGESTHEEAHFSELQSELWEASFRVVARGFDPSHLVILVSYLSRVVEEYQDNMRVTIPMLEISVDPVSPSSRPGEMEVDTDFLSEFSHKAGLSRSV